MRALQILVALRVLAADPTPAPPAGRTILLLRFGAETGAENERLREQVAVYMRDLGIDVQAVAGPAAATAASAAGDAAAAVRERGARLAFWCDPIAADHTVTLHVVDAAGVSGWRTIEHADRDASELHRAVALKLRAIISGVTPIDVPAGEARGAPASKATERAPAPPPATAPTVVVASPPPAPAASPWTSRVSAGLGYALTVPSGLAPTTHAVALEVALRFARAELALGTVLAPRATNTIQNDQVDGQLALLDVPVRLGARAMARWPRVEIGGGAFAGVHVLAAHASDATNESADSHAFAGAIGVEAVARARLTGPLLGELRPWAEVPLPRTRFWVQGQPAFDFGTRVGLTAGLVFAAP